MIARLLGHRRVKSTAPYAHLDDRDVVRAVEVVGDTSRAIAVVSTPSLAEAAARRALSDCAH